MTTGTHLEKEAARIADAIVDLVELEYGPVTLAQIDRNIPDFAKKDRPSWSYHLDSLVGRWVIWDGMTGAGYIALRTVLRDRRVALQWVDVRPYLIENYVLEDENWRPALLVSARAANLDTPHRLLRVSPKYQQYCLERAAKEKLAGYRALTPVPLHFMTDQFCIA